MNTPKMSRNKRDGIWMMTYCDGKKRIRKSLGTTDEIAARIKYAEITGLSAPSTQPAAISPLAAMQAPIAVYPEPAGMPYIEAFNKFMVSKYGIENAWKSKPAAQCAKKSTSMRGTLKAFHKHSGVYYLADINYGNLQDFIDMKSREVKNACLNTHVQRLKRFLTYCQNWEWLTVNHAMKLDRYKEDTPIRYSFSKKQVKMIWKNMSKQFLPYYQLMLETGLRACDMWGLTKDDFRIGEYGMELHLQQGKTDKWLRVPITTRAKAILDTLDHRLFPWADKSWWKERDLHNQRIQCKNALWMCFGGRKNRGCLERGKAICKPDNIRQHTLRHTFAMWHLSSGTPLEALKDLLGHKDLTMTQVYASSLSKKSLSQYVK